MEKNENFKEELENQYSILIKASEKKERKYYYIVITLLSLTLVAAIVSSIFAFIAFRASRKIMSSQEENNHTYYKTLVTRYNTGSNLELNNIGSDYVLDNPKTISITNEGDSSIVFDMKLSPISSSLSQRDNFVYTLEQENGESRTDAVPFANKTIVSDVEIEPKETINYRIKINYNGYIENSDNFYNAKIIIEQKNNNSNLLN